MVLIASYIRDEEQPYKDGTEKGQSQDAWASLGWDPDLTDEELIVKVHKLMLELLADALRNSPDSPPHGDEELIQMGGQLLSFVRRISALYRAEVRFHNWRHACHVVLAAQYLVDTAQGSGSEGRRREDNTASDRVGIDSFFVQVDPWLRFVAAFAGLIHDVKHLGVSNSQLEAQNHALCRVYRRGSYQERQSVDAGLSIFAEEFPDMMRVILSGCPAFVRLVTSAVLATDVFAADSQRKCREKFERAIACAREGRSSPRGSDASDLQGEEEPVDNERERAEAALDQIVLLADVAHCSQRYETFLRWNCTFYEERLDNYLAGHGEDPRNGWYEGQLAFLDEYVLPLAKRCEQLMPPGSDGVLLSDGVKRIRKRWQYEGQKRTETMIEALSHRHILVADFTSLKCSPNCDSGACSVASIGVGSRKCSMSF